MAIKLTDTQLVLPSAAAQRKDRCLVAPETLKGGASQKVANDAGGAHRVAQTRVCAVIRERVGAGDSVYRISNAPAHRGDRTVPQPDAMDGRGPNWKATQAA
jgi:hypothetical protein